MTNPSPARMYDYALGGKDNYAVDREAGDKLLAIAPFLKGLALDNRSFLRRAVQYLAGQVGIRQFLDIGAGLPTVENTHQIAQQLAPGARTVYVDNDPMAAVHGRALLTDDGSARYLEADVRDPEQILGSPTVGDFVDLSQPVGVLLIAVLHFVADEDRPQDLVARYATRLPSNSHIVISHVADEGPPELLQRLTAVYKDATAQIRLRPRSQIEAMFAGLDLVPPSVVDIHQWRPHGDQQPGPLLVWGGAGRIT